MLHFALGVDLLAAEVLEEDDALQIMNRVSAAIGLATVPSTPGETFWAVRRLFEALARRRPLVAVIDDIHWAEPAFLDLVEHLTDWIRDAPVLLLCLARPDLVETRPSWGGGKLNATTILLEPLSEYEADALIENLPGGRGLTDDMRMRLAEAAEGNPLFLEQTLAMLREEDPEGRRLPVPPTIQALLEARLDRLPGGERIVLERAAVVDRDFRRSALAELAAELPQAALDEHLAELVRKDLIRPERGERGEDSFRFRHSLIRAAAYDSLPMEERARLHELLAEALDRTPGERADLDEIIGFHLEQAYGYRIGLEPVSNATRTLGTNAAERLARAGRRAYSRGDLAAAVGLLSRAVALTPASEPGRVEVLADLAEALRETGDFRGADELLQEVQETAAALGNRRVESEAVLIRLRSQLQTDPQLDAEELQRRVAETIVVLEDEGDEALLAKAWELMAWAPWLRGQVAEAEAALQRAAEYARRAGDRRTEAQSLHLLVGAALYGPAPVSEGARLCESILARLDEQQRVRAAALRALGALRAMHGRFDEGRELLEQQRAMLEDLGLTVTAASSAETFGFLELLADDPAAAERELRIGSERLERLGETNNLPNIAAMLAQALLAQGRVDEALAYTELSEQTSAREDLSAQVQWRSARAKVLAALGHTDEAEALARSAVALAEQTDFLILRADALLDLARVVGLSGQEGAEAVEEAIRLYELKENLVSAAKARALLQDVRAS